MVAQSSAAIFGCVGEAEARILDLCCGTGDMTFALRQRAGKAARILGADFSHTMLQRAATKSTGTSLRWVEADALQLPFPSAHFDLVTSAFGFRNLADYDAGLREIARILGPNGECGILDFGEPRGVIGQFYRIYFKHVLPAVGTLISGVKGPMPTCRRRSNAFPSPKKCCNACGAPVFAKFPGRRTPLELPDYMQEKSDLRFFS